MMSSKMLFVMNDAPYGSERTYNALRLAHTLAKKEPTVEVAVFLMADEVIAAKAGQYNIERMLKGVLAGGGRVLLCGTCMDARGLDESALVTGARRSTMDELAASTLEADKVIVF
jgi:uncharacterized protein involved in oxidation of intracellular sulfur